MSSISECARRIKVFGSYNWAFLMIFSRRYNHLLPYMLPIVQHFSNSILYNKQLGISIGIGLLTLVLLIPGLILAYAEIKIAAVGDISCDTDATKTIQGVQQFRPNVTLFLGDLSYKTSPTCFLKLASSLMTNSTTKIAIGNHDSAEDGTVGLEGQYLKAFNLSKPYYSFNYSKVHFLIMSTQLNSSDGGQIAFVTQDLKQTQNNSNFTIVMMHKPLYTSPSKHPAEIGYRNIYSPLFQKYGVDIVLQAHNHVFETLAPNGNNSKPLYITVGTGGKSHYPLTGKETFSIAQDNIDFGFLGLTLNGSKLGGALYTNGGKIKNNFTSNQLN